MSLFEVMSTIAGAFGLEIKPTGGSTIRESMPSPNAQPVFDKTTNNAQPLQVDDLGLLAMRGQILTDEGSFRDNFNTPAGSLNTALGTATFTNASLTVTGTGFLTVGVSRDSYVRLTADGNAAWARVARVVSATTLELEAAYTGAGGTGASEFTNWVQAAVTGSSLAVAGSNVTFTTGTTTGGTVSVRRTVDYGMQRWESKFSITNRVANNEIIAGFTSTSTAGGAEEAHFFFAGAVTTEVTCRVKAQGGAFESLSVTLPNGLTTATSSVYSIEVGRDSVLFYVNGILLAELSNQIPSPYRSLDAIFQSFNNGALGGSLTVVIDYIAVLNDNTVSVSSLGQSKALSTFTAEDVHYIAANLTSTATTEQSVLTFTVPAGKTLYLLSWAITGDSATVTATYKIGKSAANPLTEPASPNAGVADAVIYQAGVLPATIGARVEGTSDYTPMKLAGAGEIVRINVIPSAVTSTIFRAVLRYVLR